MNTTVSLHEQKRSVKGKVYVYWILRWIDNTGRRRGQNIGRSGRNGLSERHAKKLRDAKQAELDSNPDRRDVTITPGLGEFVEHYLASRKGELTEGTLELHEQTGRYLVGFFGGNRQLKDVTRLQARAFKTELAAGKLSHVNKKKAKKPPEQTTVDRHMREARKIFAVAKDDGLITTNPFDKLKQNKAVAKEWHYVDEEEFEKLLDACSPTWRLLLALARWAGLRLDEAIQLPWRKVDLAKSVVRIEARGDWRPKDGDTRTIPILFPRLRQLLAEARGRDPEAEMVLAGRVGESNVWRDFQSLFRRSGVKPYSKPMHSLRKSCITDWARKHPTHFVKEWAGHSDYRTTMTYYLQVRDVDLEAIIAQASEENAGD